MVKICLIGMNTVSYGDIDFSDVEALGEATFAYPETEEEIIRTCQGADVVLINKAEMTRKVISSLPSLKYIGAFATGYNNVDLAACKEFGVTFCNAPGYSTEAVAQHTIAFLLAMAGSLPRYINAIDQGRWLSSKAFSFYDYPMSEVNGKTLGIFGMGNIGKRVAVTAQALGMNVIFYNRSKVENTPFQQVEKEELFSKSDYLSLHCALNEQTKEVVNEYTLSLMKPTAVIINTARGPLINEAALAKALNEGKLRGACLDVLVNEPMREDCPLHGAKNVYFTPHAAWNPVETRQRLEKQVADTLKAFLEGHPYNVITK